MAKDIFIWQWKTPTFHGGTNWFLSRVTYGFYAAGARGNWKKQSLVSNTKWQNGGIALRWSRQVRVDPILSLSSLMAHRS